MEFPEKISRPLAEEKVNSDKEFEDLRAKEQLEKEINHLKRVLSSVQEQLHILENRSDRTQGYTMHLLQKLMTIVEKNEKESKNPFRFIKDVFKTVKNSVVWVVNQIGNQEYYVDDETFQNIINSNFGEESPGTQEYSDDDDTI